MDQEEDGCFCTLTGELLFPYFKSSRIQILCKVCQEAWGERIIRSLGWCWLSSGWQSACKVDIAKSD